MQSYPHPTKGSAIDRPEHWRDEFGEAVTAADAASVAVWRAAYDEMLRFTGDPLTRLDAVNRTDASFVIGPVFTLTARLLGGVDRADPAVVADVVRLHSRIDGATDRERGHAEAALLLHAGEFLAAAARWDDVSVRHPGDLTAARFVHDVCLHIGDDTIRLPSARRAVQVWPVGSRAHGLANGMLAFALEETGHAEEAERCGRVALEHDDADMWARHALAHVYESQARHDTALELLVPSSAHWSTQNMLSGHLWWHVGIRLLHHGAIDDAIDVLDERLTSRTAFGLADSTSLLWRLALNGAAVDGRWDALADSWAANSQRHTCGFLDLHAALAFAAVPTHRGADPFWSGVPASHAAGDTFNDLTFRRVVTPMVSGLRAFGEGDTAGAVDALESVTVDLARIGGSVLQRDVVGETLAVARSR